MFRIKKGLAAVLAASVLLLPASAPAQVRADEQDIIPKEDIKSDITNYRSEEIRLGTFSKEESTSGYAYFPSETGVIYEGRTALFVESLVEYGDFVEEGQELLRVEVERDEAEITALDLKLARTKKSFENGRKTRLSEISDMNLNRDKLADPFEIQKANLNIQRKEIELNRYIYQTERDIEKQEKAIAELEEENSVAVVTAPIAGKITEEKFYQDGDYVNDGDVVFKITDTSVFYISAESSSFHYGTEMTVSAFARGKQYDMPGTVVVCTADLPNVKEKRVIIRVELSKDLEMMASRMGGVEFSAVRMVIAGETVHVENVMLLPIDAREGNGQEVFARILDENNTTHRRMVSSVYTNRDYAWVFSGLHPGDRVVLK